MTEMEIILALIWVVCGVLAYGLTFGDYQREWPELSVKNYQSDRQFAFFIAITGPIGLVVSLINNRGHGFKWE